MIKYVNVYYRRDNHEKPFIGMPVSSRAVSDSFRIWPMDRSHLFTVVVKIKMKS